MDTVFARSTAVGRAGIAVVRISGPSSWQVVKCMTRVQLPAPRYAALRKIWYEEEILDQAVVVLFEEGHSFTGEESAELHLHGSEGVVRRVLHALGQFEGMRSAQAGEFSRRALENNRVDLTEIEGLNALLVAETEAQRRQAMRVFDGALRQKVDRWRRELISLLAALEVTVDFADEDVPQEVSEQAQKSLSGLADAFHEEAESSRAAEHVARGFEVAIVGAPNVGKSTLLNRLAQREAALISDIPGTTRDVLEVRLEVAGQLVTLLDTAGIRDSTDSVERAGVERARQRAESADLRVFVDEIPFGMTVAECDVMVVGKSDIRPDVNPGLRVSGRTGEGIAELLECIGDRLSSRVQSSGVAITQRQGQCLEQAATSLGEAALILREDRDRTEFVSNEVQRAIRSLDEVIGRVSVEDVLGEIFSEFCIGK